MNLKGIIDIQHFRSPPSEVCNRASQLPTRRLFMRAGKYNRFVFPEMRPGHRQSDRQSVR